MEPWVLNISDISLGGLAPGYFNETYPSYGNTNHAGDMFQMSPFSLGYIEPSHTLTTFIASEASAVSTTINAFKQLPSNQTVVYGTGGNAIYKITALSGTIDKIHTISAIATSVGNAIESYGNSVFYRWHSSIAADADIGKYNISAASFDDSWFTGTMSGSLYGSGAETGPLRVGGNDVLYWSNKNFISSFDYTNIVNQALDLPETWRIQDIHWVNDRLIIATTHNSFSSQSHGTSTSSLLIWDGTTTSWETEIPVAGFVGAGFVKNGIYYQFYFDGYTNKLAELQGTTLVDLTEYSVGWVPTYNQVADYRGFLVWGTGGSSDDIFCYGPMDSSEPRRLFHLLDAGSTTAGKVGGINSSIQNPGGILVGNNDALYYYDDNTSLTYNTTGTYWKSILYLLGGKSGETGKIDSIRFDFEKLTSGAVLDWSLVDNQGRTIYSDTISYAKATATTPLHTLTSALYKLNGLNAENLRIELSYANGSTTAPVRVKRIQLHGRS